MALNFIEYVFILFVLWCSVSHSLITKFSEVNNYQWPVEHIALKPILPVFV